MLLGAALWELTVRSGLVTLQFLPAPSGILTAAGRLLASGELARNSWHTVTVTLVGWTGSSLLGVGMGVVLGLSPTAYRYSMTSFEVTRAIPPITFVPAAVLLLGFSSRMELLIVVYVGVWPVMVNTIGGIREVPDELRDSARTLRMSKATTVRKVVLPSALPSILVGLRLALSLCLVLAIVAEMIGNPAGMGNALIRAQQALQPEQMFAYVVATGLLGVGLNGALGWLATWVLPASDADDGCGP